MDEDLSDVAINVRGRRRADEAGRRLANSSLTRAYLDAGMQLLEREFFEERAAEEGLRRPLSTLTRDGVLAETAKRNHELSTPAGAGSFRDRWEHFPDFLGDLVRYAMRTRTRRSREEFSGDLVRRLSDPGHDMSSLLHEVAYQQTLVAVDSTALRLQLLGTAMAEPTDAVRDVLADIYVSATVRWQTACREILDARALQLRPGVSLEDLTVILIALTEGLLLRSIGERDRSVLDNRRRRSLLGIAAVALAAGCIDTGDGMDIGDLVDSIAARGPRKPSG